MNTGKHCHRDQRYDTAIHNGKNIRLCVNTEE